jgi:CspA family cold shock protein
MPKGTVKFFNDAKGFGFITQDSGSDIFLHATGLLDDLREGDDVEFEVKDGKKGLNAVNVRLA